MSPLKILHVDENHPLMLERLERLGYHNDLAYTTPLEEILKTINTYDGMVIRSRFPIDKKFIDTAQNLRFIARVGAGLENIDVKYAQSKNIHLVHSYKKQVAQIKTLLGEKGDEVVAEEQPKEESK